MGDMFIAPIPQCPTHGKMHWSAPDLDDGKPLEPGEWICHGFDGEGCDYAITTDEMDWHKVDAEHFEWGGSQ